MADINRPSRVDPRSTTEQTALLRVLLKLGLIKQEQLKTQFFTDDYLPVAYFASRGIFAEADAIKKVALELSIPAPIPNESLELSCLALLDDPALSRLSSDVWKTHRAVPYEYSAGVLSVLCANPLNMDLPRAIEFELRCKVQTAIAPESFITQTYTRKFEGHGGLDFSSLLENSTPQEVRNTSGAPASFESNVGSEDISTPTVVRLVNRILLGSVQQKASDLHLTPQNETLQVKLRVDGITRDWIEIPGNLKNPVISRVKVLCGMDIAEKRQPQDGRLRLKTPAGSRDLRVSTIPTVHGEDIVARILEPELREITFSGLGMPNNVAGAFNHALRRSSKVIVVTGPTGSGKTSTLYAALLHLHDGTSRIITIEDPIEYRIHGLSQIQVNPKIGMTFAKALRSILRQDPDVIMVGEVRDNETASSAMQVAQTGHLVLSTLHTNTATAAITRLRDLGVPSFLIASSLGSVLSQRLVRRLCTNCLQAVQGSQLERCKQLGVDTQKLMQAKGCADCGNTGFCGRIGVFSFLDVTPEVAEAIRADAGELEIERVARAQGFLALHDAALLLAQDQITSLEEIERVLGPLDDFADFKKSKTAEKGIPEKPSQNNSTDGRSIQRKKVLLVDDDENIHFVYRTLLENEMFEVTEAMDGQEALKKIYEDTPEIVLCDLMMPRMNGLELVEKLRSDARTSEIPILMLSAAATDENELKLIKSGADDFVSKTARPEIILARINRLLGRTPTPR